MPHTVKLFNPHKQASHVGAVFMPMCSSFAACSQTLSSPSCSSLLGRRAAFPRHHCLGFWLRSTSGRHCEIKGMKESEAKILLPGASGCSNLLSKSSSCWIQPAAPSMELVPICPGSEATQILAQPKATNPPGIEGQ